MPPRRQAADRKALAFLAPLSGRRARLTGLHSETGYRVWAGGAALDITTRGPSGSPAASIGDGAIRLDGAPFFPLVVYALCPSGYTEALATGISLYEENGCGRIGGNGAASAR